MIEAEGKRVQVLVRDDFLQEGKKKVEELGTFDILARMSRSSFGVPVTTHLSDLVFAASEGDSLLAEEANIKLKNALPDACVSYGVDEKERQQFGIDMVVISALRIDLLKRCKEGK